MCVIIKRNPNIIIPEEKIVSACTVNPDGFGISIIDRGKMVTEKIHKSSGNDSKEVLRLLDESRDLSVFLHLRFTTAGKTNEENCHPFTVFEGDNYQVQFMHNGTLSKFSKGRDDDHSDTWHFNEEILKPTIRAFYEVEGAGVLLSPVVKKILAEFQSGSVFTLYDNEGNVLTLENSSCKQFEGWWSSNTYSFDRTHREPAKTTSGVTAYYGGYDAYRDYQDYRNYSPAKAAPAPKAAAPFVDTSTKTQAKKVGHALMAAKRLNAEPADLTPPQDRLTFCDLAELHDIKDIMILTEGDIHDIVCDMPLAATALIMDLIHELWVKEQKEKLDRKKTADVVPFSNACAV